MSAILLALAMLQAAIAGADIRQLWLLRLNDHETMVSWACADGLCFSYAGLIDQGVLLRQGRS